MGDQIDGDGGIGTTDLGDSKPRHRTDPLEGHPLAEQIRARLDDVFIGPLTCLLDNGPSAKTIARWAQSNPLGWSQALSTIAKLAGWNERTEVRHTGVIGHIHAMSDAELIMEARRLVESQPKVDSHALDARQVCEKSAGLQDARDVTFSIEEEDGKSS